MKIAIIGSRNLSPVDIEKYLPINISEIVSGGAKGVDRIAAYIAKKNNIPLVEFLPDYARYKRGAPLKRNEEIVKYADEAIAFWDGKSKGTLFTVELFKKAGKKVTVILMGSSC